MPAPVHRPRAPIVPRTPIVYKIHLASPLPKTPATWVGSIMGNLRRQTFKAACIAFFAHPDLNRHFCPDTMQFKGRAVVQG